MNLINKANVYPFELKRIMELEKIIKFSPAFHKINDDPKKNYGVGCLHCFMVLKSKDKAVHFTFGTGMYLQKTYDYWASKNLRLETNKPDYMGYDVGYHTAIPQFKGQEIRHPTKMRKIGTKALDIAFDKIGKNPPQCEWIDVPCYCDGSALRPKEYFYYVFLFHNCFVFL